MGLRIGLANPDPNPNPNPNPNLNPNPNPNQVRGWQADFAAGTLRLPAAVRAWLRERVSSAAVDDTLTMHTMRTVHARCGYLLDPHTAVAKHVIDAAPRPDEDAVPMLISSTAHYGKFASDVTTQALPTTTP